MHPHPHRKGRKHQHHHMDSTALRAEFSALRTVSEDQFEAALASALADFDTFVAAQPAPAPAADPVVSFTETHQSGATVVFPVTQS
jgi:hypothetical protein